MNSLGVMPLSTLESQKNVLSHYGIKGQKWGNRRFQNEDGSLTEEGKRRYGKESSRYSEDSRKWKSKDAHSLSDEELNRRNSRLQRERQYKDLTVSPVKKEFIAAAKKIFVGTIVGVSVAAMAKNYKTVLDTGSEFLKAVGIGHSVGQAVKGKIAAIALSQIIKNTKIE